MRTAPKARGTEGAGGTTWGQAAKPVRSDRRWTLFKTRLLATLYKQARHFRNEKVFEKFRTPVFDHQRPFRCKMSAMVGNFVHKIRSYRVLEAPDWPKLIRNAAISELCGRWQLATLSAAPLVRTCPQHDRTRLLSSLLLDLRTLPLPGLPLALPRGAGK